MENDKLVRLSDVLAVATTPEKCDGYNLYPPSHGELLERINNIPAVDAVEVRHLAWAHLGGDEWLCPACGHVISTEGSWEHPLVVGKKFCENCGARMDERREEVQK